MRIDAYMQVNQVYKPNKVTPTNTASQVSKGDSFTLSGFAKDYQIAKQATSEASDIREDKVNDIVERMKSGTYNVPIEDVADNLVGRLLG
ncbi:flagellar biosynthesis anti-sigma factor FlgM [Eubacterium xylanophilum]|uniref:flagellar biosynthesis anti-sigma factor FlgM n=1 Tax=Eubacterium xylanophilum TaxID=39497 RepID=UPI00047DD79C|nr:flagellar biosynthesis anti-sigma factor FlgM [Eubacterium xylanophilum]MCR5798281.1 flagellar biosynthesis anti-sigma factor FlgM [Eubacterium sp.]